MKEKIVFKLRKIYQLAESGAPGEKELAKQLLRTLLVKYGLKEEDLISEKKFEVEIRYKTQRHLRLIAQIYGHLFGERMACSCFKIMGKKYVYVKLTPLNKAELLNYLSTYIPALEKEEKKLKKRHAQEKKSQLGAFVRINNLYATGGKGKPMTKQEIKNALNAMKGMDYTPPPRKTINEKNGQ